ncbi:MAG: hypothetical protein P8Y05_14770 [Deinococcales bacterium]
MKVSTARPRGSFEPPLSTAAAVPMVVVRLVGFVAFQAIIAGLYAWMGRADAWSMSAAWWPVTATLTNVLCLVLLRSLLHREGRRYRDFWHVERGTARADVLVVLGLLAVSVPLVLLPNFGLAQWLFGDPQAPAALFFGALPRWAALGSLVAFPTTVAMAELPTYFGYAMPRLAARWGLPAVAVVVAAFFLGAQHAGLPLRFDGAFVLWRFLMFMPFAFLLGVALHWRPRLLPYLMVVHGLLDLQAAWIVFVASTA